MKCFIFLSLFLGSINAFATTPVPDFTVQVGQEQNAKMRGWLLNFLPPAHHHFNVDAPMKVTALSDQVAFIKVGAVKEHVGFRSSDQKLKPGSDATASIFLCDDAKTYCVKKTLNFALTVNSDLNHLDFSKSVAPTTPALKTKKPANNKKDQHGFWDNNASAAFAEAEKTHKPVLIDFYGIWCPPCNLLNETVFPKTAFKETAKKWILLKMDADAPESFALKSHFKIGGYPTLLAMKSPTSPAKSRDASPVDLTSFEEIDRIVGYYPVGEFVTLLNKAYADRALGLDAKLTGKRDAYVQNLKDLIAIKFEKKELKETLALSQEGEKITNPASDHFFALTSLSLRATDTPALFKDPASIENLKATWSNREKETPETLMKLEDILSNQADQFSKEQIAWANDVLDALEKRVSPDTLSVPGVELSIADIDSMRVDVAEALKDEALLKKTYARVIASYQKLIQKFKGEDSRGFNLELGYYLWKSGSRDEARALYSKFIKKYPNEFTFYYAASKMYLEQKDYPVAQDYAEKAVKYSYGDNQVRSMERLVRVLIAEGEAPVAAKRGKDFLAGAEKPANDLSIRTGHYLQSLQKAVDEAEKGKL